jgi:hypothetical protein
MRPRKKESYDSVAVIGRFNISTTSSSKITVPSRDGSVPSNIFVSSAVHRGRFKGYETMHKIRKGQVRRVRNGDIRVQNRFIDQVFGGCLKSLSRSPSEPILVLSSIFATHPLIRIIEAEWVAIRLAQCDL